MQVFQVFRRFGVDVNSSCVMILGLKVRISASSSELLDVVIFVSFALLGWTA